MFLLSLHCSSRIFSKLMYLSVLFFFIQSIALFVVILYAQALKFAGSCNFLRPFIIPSQLCWVTSQAACALSVSRNACYHRRFCHRLTSFSIAPASPSWASITRSWFSISQRSSFIITVVYLACRQNTRMRKPSTIQLKESPRNHRMGIFTISPVIPQTAPTNTAARAENGTNTP